jgi:photosystem II stability/assembly factor-like uncharacterized protein
MYPKVISLSIAAVVSLIATGASGQPSWAPVSFPVQNIAIDAIAVDSHDRLYAGTEGQGIFRSTDLGSSWDSAGLPYYNFNSIVFDSDDIVFVATDLGLFRSEDHGLSWVRADSSMEDKTVKALAFNQSNVLFAGNVAPGGNTGKILRSTDEGASWEDLTTVPNGCHALAVSRVGTVLASTGGVKLRSTDDGITWNEITGINSAVLCFASDSSGDIYAGGTGFGGGNLWKSSDDGVTWFVKSNGLPTDYNYWISSICVAGNGQVFLGISNGGGVWRSTDHADSWSVTSANLGDMRITELAISKDGYLFAATLTGIWRTDSPVTSVSEGPRNIPIVFTLAQNYPNPFNPSTTIRYALPERSHVTLTVFNTLGQQVVTLVGGEVEAGYHEVTFDASEFASGVYLYRLTTGDYVQTRKVVVLR